METPTERVTSAVEPVLVQVDAGELPVSQTTVELVEVPVFVPETQATSAVIEAPDTVATVETQAAPPVAETVATESAVETPVTVNVAITACQATPTSEAVLETVVSEVEASVESQVKETVGPSLVSSGAGADISIAFENPMGAIKQISGNTVTGPGMCFLIQH